MWDNRDLALMARQLPLHSSTGLFLHRWAGIAMVRTASKIGKGMVCKEILCELVFTHPYGVLYLFCADLAVVGLYGAGIL